MIIFFWAVKSIFFFNEVFFKVGKIVVLRIKYCFMKCIFFFKNLIFIYIIFIKFESLRKIDIEIFLCEVFNLWNILILYSNIILYDRKVFYMFWI